MRIRDLKVETALVCALGPGGLRLLLPYLYSHYSHWIRLGLKSCDATHGLEPRG